MLQLVVLRRRAMYVKPEVTRYSGRELLGLIGPVETAYCDIPPTLEDCGSWTLSIPLYMENPDWIYVGPRGFSEPLIVKIDEQGVTVEDGVVTIESTRCIAPPDTYEVEFGFGIGDPGEPTDTCLSCVQVTEITPQQ
jgi:hypothetical protein